MTDKPFKDHYCPICLHPVCERTGDHWHYCEYERALGDWINPQQPLTRLEMLKKKLSKLESDKKKLLAQTREIRHSIRAIERKIEQAPEGKQ